jgi:hypothetical protein
MVAQHGLDKLIKYAVAHELLREIFREFAGPPAPNPKHDLATDVQRQDIKDLTKPGVLVSSQNDADMDVEKILGGREYD